MPTRIVARLAPDGVRILCGRQDDRGQHLCGEELATLRCTAVVPAGAIAGDERDPRSWPDFSDERVRPAGIVLARFPLRDGDGDPIPAVVIGSGWKTRWDAEGSYYERTTRAKLRLAAGRLPLDRRPVINRGLPTWDPAFGAPLAGYHMVRLPERVRCPKCAGDNRIEAAALGQLGTPELSPGEAYYVHLDPILARRLICAGVPVK